MSDEQNNDTPAEDDGIAVVNLGTKAAEPAPAAEPEAKPEADKPADPVKPPKAADPDEDLPLGVQKRLTRAERQVEDAERKADEFDAKLKQAQAMIDALKAQKEGKAGKYEVNPNDYPTYEEYAAARSAREKAGAEADAPPPPADPDFDEARGDLSEAIRSVDRALWDKLTAPKLDDKGKQVFTAAGEPLGEINGLSRDVIVELADADDPVATARAFAALTDEERAEIASMSKRGVRRALRELATKPATKPEEPKAPPRDPNTGQFRKPSAAPEPITPVGGSSPTRPLEKMSPDEFSAHRNAEERQRSAWDWS